jgi:hypothetical protein
MASRASGQRRDGQAGGPLGGRTITTGQGAWWAQCWLTEPRSKPEKPPCPREPTISSSAPWAAARRARAGSSATVEVVISTSLGTPATALTRAASHSSRSCGARSTSSSLAPGIGSHSQNACRALRLVWRSLASFRANRSVSFEVSEPSMPTTITPVRSPPLERPTSYSNGCRPSHTFVAIGVAPRLGRAGSAACGRSARSASAGRASAGAGFGMGRAPPRRSSSRQRTRS